MTKAVWEQARRELGAEDDASWNIAALTVDRHARGPLADKVALRFFARGEDAPRDHTYAELSRRSGRFADALRRLGVEPGDRLSSLLGRCPELMVVALGTLKRRAVFCPLFSAFGSEPVQTRLAIAEMKALVTTPELYRKKVAPIRDALPALEHIIVVCADGEAAPEGTLDYRAAMAEADEGYRVEATGPEEPALLHFTSGTTGKPKGALHVHAAVLVHHASAGVALDLKREDIYWCTADPGWVTGTSYGIIAPLARGATLIFDEGEFELARWCRILAEQRVTVWYTAPTAVRMMMRAGAGALAGHDFSALRFLASVGEPLNPEAVTWGEEVFGRPFHDNWWQSETGAIMIANRPGLPIRPGSMGKPLPGIEAFILERSEHGGARPAPVGAEGELALRPGWPSMFRGYWREPERYNRCFVAGYYLTGDLARQDEDGYFWFVGRADDMIKSAGHFIGPFEVESALIEHEAVTEAAVFGVPDPVVGEVVKACVVLKAGFEADKALGRSLRAHARKRLGPAVAPRSIVIVPSLPKTRSGKILRRVLRARELGLPLGDTSTMEET